MSELNVNHLLWFRLLQTSDGAYVEQTVEQNTTSGSCCVSGYGLSIHLTIHFIIEITMRWTEIDNGTTMLASLMGLLEKNTTITSLSVERE